MQYRNLGRTDLSVSTICLGSMTWGEQNTEPEAHAQLDMALEAGVNFVDAAEMYPFPAREETTGETERCIGRWLKRSRKRDKVVIATKVSGPASGWLTWIRGGDTRLDRMNIEAAIDGSLQRLQTDYIDLYQLHWPDRSTNYFSKLGYQHDPSENAVPIHETLEVMSDLVRAGKIRHIGVSNETPWGTMTYLEHAERNGQPRIVSIQNPYSLLNRTFEIGLAEVAHREGIGLLPYSPLGFGVLTGKYLGGAEPADTRLTLFKQFSRYTNDAGVKATEAYVKLARSHGLSPTQMALAYVLSRPFVTSVIIGATRLEQLQENLASVDLELSEDVLRAIEEIHQDHHNPCP